MPDHGDVPSRTSRVTGLLLAAGAGRRMGRPKALLRHPDGRSWVAGAVRVLLDGGCDDVLVVVGASADAVRAELARSAPSARVVEAGDWQQGMGASLRRALAALEPTDAAAALVHLVDLPDIGADVVSRLTVLGAGPEVLVRAAFHGEPGHPVLIGRAHWAAVTAAASGDRGARDYLATQGAALVECGDLATGRDRDTGEA